MNDLVANMHISKDLETALLSFFMAEMFCNYSRLHAEILLRKKDISEAVMACLRDRDLTALQKKDALRLVPFLIGDRESIQMFLSVRIEDYLVDFLRTQKSND